MLHCFAELERLQMPAQPVKWEGWVMTHRREAIEYKIDRKNGCHDVGGLGSDVRS